MQNSDSKTVRAEIILACRGEIPENLQRTIKNIKATIGKYDKISVILDGPHQHLKYRLPDKVAVHQPYDLARGPGQCRHWAIMRSKAEYVTLVDGHMTFPDGWIDEICDHLSENYTDITACHMRGLDHNWIEINGEAVYDGCHIELTSREPSRKNWAINSVWNKERLDFGAIGSIMGACYGIRREWYRDIGEPLSILEAWGGDEEILSLCSWLMGGRCYLLPVTCGHIWAAPRERHGGNDISVNEWREIWANQYSMLEALPIPDAEKEELIAFIDRGNNRNEIMREHVKTRTDRIAVLKAKLENAIHSWEFLKTAQIIRPIAPTPAPAMPESPAPLPPQALVRACPFCQHPAPLNMSPHYRPRCRKCRRIIT